MPKKQRNAPNAPKIAHPSIPQTELLLIALPIATMSVNAPMTRHQTGIGTIMIEFFSTILDKIFRVYALLDHGRTICYPAIRKRVLSDGERGAGRILRAV